jgi:hypothetical protein
MIWKVVAKQETNKGCLAENTARQPLSYWRMLGAPIAPFHAIFEEILRQWRSLLPLELKARRQMTSRTASAPRVAECRVWELWWASCY